MSAAAGSPPRAQTPGLYAKLAEAIAEVESVQKDGTNQHFNYSYSSAEAIYRVIRGPLLSRGLVVVPSIADSVHNGNDAILKLALTITDSATGEQLQAQWEGEGSDSSDKATAKAVTGGMKTWLRHLFLLPSDDDPDAESPTRANGQASKKMSGAASDSQREWILGKGNKKGLLSKANFSPEEFTAIGNWAQVDGKLQKDQASQIITWLKDGDVEGRAALLAAVGFTDLPAPDTDGLGEEPGDESIPF